MTYYYNYNYLLSLFCALSFSLSLRLPTDVAEFSAFNVNVALTVAFKRSLNLTL
jgi:hypothetical protein